MNNRIIDVAQDVGHIADKLKKSGIATVIRYYNHKNGENNPSKQLTLREAEQLTEAGLSLAVIFEQRGGAAKKNETYGHIEDFSHGKGKADAIQALSLAEEIKQPKGSAIYFAVDWDFIKPSELQTIKEYFSEIHSMLQNKFKVGVYGSGFICKMLLDAKLVDYTWLTVSKGWTDTKKFLASGAWDLNQTKENNGTHNDLGVSYDENILRENLNNFGAFTIKTDQLEARLVDDALSHPAPIIKRITARSGLILRSGPGQAFTRLQVIPYDQEVYILGQDETGKWLRVDLENDGRADGYCFSEYLETVAGGLPPILPNNLNGKAITPIEIAEIECKKGIYEIKGSSHNKEILKYHASLPSNFKTDETPWCSAFVNYCVHLAGYATDNITAMAQSWKNWGTDVTSEAQIGDIVVFRSTKQHDDPKSSSGHVGFFKSETNDTITVLGGNQNDMIKISTYPKNGKLGNTYFKLLSIRRA